jgi:hypothetical protein
MVDTHTVSREELDNMCDTPTVCSGHASWHETPEGQTVCDIYMLSRTEYPNDGAYHLTLGHEFRHCLDGEFH